MRRLLFSGWAFGPVIVFMLLLSCGKTITEYRVKGEFRYVNTLPFDVSLQLKGSESGARFDVYAIAAGDTLILYTDGDSHQQIADPVFYRPPVAADTMTIQFRDTLCYSEYGSNGHLLQNIASYTAQKRGERDYLFYYRIDSTIVLLSGRCL